MIMRSNAAWTLLPYNIFEFTLLGELVAVMAGIPLGEYTHFALSMHLYKGDGTKQDEVELAQKASAWQPEKIPPPMPSMPSTSLEDLRRVTLWEADLRYSAKGINVTNYRDHIKKCKDDCAPYWAQLCLALLAYVLLINRKIEAAMTVLEEVSDPLSTALRNQPMVHALNIPGLEEEPRLLESRLHLLQYANRGRLPEERREQLWRGYHAEFLDSLGTAERAERRRQPAVSIKEWESRDGKLRERERQPELLKK